MGKSAEYVRTIRLDERMVDSLLDRLDGQESSGSGEYAYRLRSCVVFMQQPGDGTPVAYVVPTRRLGNNLIRFIHGGFIHPESRCIIQLISQHGTWENATGRVQECTHIEASVHEVVVAFDHPVDVGTYCPDAVSVRVLLVEDDPQFAKLAVTLLRKLNASVEVASNGLEALDKTSQSTFDLILADIEMPEMDGLETTRQLRSRGYKGRIVATTGRCRDEDRAACEEAGFDAYLGKPFGVAALKEQIESLREEPLFSTLGEDSDLSPLIGDFVNGIPEQVRKIENALNGSELGAVESLCRRLKSEAGSLGFEPISDAARKIEKSVQDGQHDALQDQVNELTRWCRLARSNVSAR